MIITNSYYRNIFVFVVSFCVVFAFNHGCLAEENKPAPAKRTVSELTDAALEGNTEVLYSAIKYGFDPNQIDELGRTLLMFASYNGHTETVKMLIEEKADVNIADNSGTTALMWASSGPFADTVALLLKNGAAVNSVDINEHFSALMWASSEGQLEVVKLLLDSGANMTLKDIDGDTAESFARQKKHYKVADLLAKTAKEN